MSICEDVEQDETSRPGKKYDCLMVKIHHDMPNREDRNYLESQITTMLRSVSRERGAEFVVEIVG